MEKVLVITGGSSGIGAATVALFLQKGWRVFELSRRDTATPSPHLKHISCDVADESACRQAISQVLAETGHIDVLISNAGAGISGPVEFTDTAEAKWLFDVNFFGALNITKAVLPHMRSCRAGRILYTSSVAAPLSVPYQAFYSATKAAINDMALALQNEVRSFGIQVGCLLPGDVRTGFTDARRKSVAGADVYTRAEKAVSQMEHDEQSGMSPEQMARLFYRMATRRYLPIYTVGGAQYKFFCLLEKMLPKSLVNWIEGQLYG